MGYFVFLFVQHFYIFMFSRIQTVFLLLVAVAMFSLLFLPIFTKKDSNNEVKANLTAFSLAYKKENKTQNVPTFYIAITAIMAGTLALYSVLRYRNQIKDTKSALFSQMRFSMFISLLVVITAILIVFFKLQTDKLVPVADSGGFGIGFFCIPVALLSNFLASRFIRNDFNQIKSMDRLR